MKVLGVAGWSGSGKTTLLVTLVPILAARGIRVSTVKHAHHAFDVDRPGKDSWRHREAGAEEVLVASSRRWALMHELRREPEPGLSDLLARLSPVDLVLVEGYKEEPHPKLVVHRTATGGPPLWRGDPSVLAVATDRPAAMAGEDAVVLDLDDGESIADFIVSSFGLGK